MDQTSLPKANDSIVALIRKVSMPAGGGGRGVGSRSPGYSDAYLENRILHYYYM